MFYDIDKPMPKYFNANTYKGSRKKQSTVSPSHEEEKKSKGKSKT